MAIDEEGGRFTQGGDWRGKPQANRRVWLTRSGHTAGWDHGHVLPQVLVGCFPEQYNNEHLWNCVSIFILKLVLKSDWVSKGMILTWSVAVCGVVLWLVNILSLVTYETSDWLAPFPLMIVLGFEGAFFSGVSRCWKYHIMPKPLHVLWRIRAKITPANEITRVFPRFED